MKKKSKKSIEEIVETSVSEYEKDESDEVVETKPTDAGRSGIMGHMILGSARASKGLGRLFWYGMAVLCVLLSIPCFVVGIVFPFFSITGVMLIIGAIFLGWIGTKF